MSKLLIIIYVVFTSLALIVLRLGSKDGAPASVVDGKLSLNINAQTVVGIILYAVSFVIYTYLISKFDLGYIVPITTALVYIIIFTASYFIFKETFTTIKVLGILLIVGGIILLNLGSRK